MSHVKPLRHEPKSNSQNKNRILKNEGVCVCFLELT